MRAANFLVVIAGTLVFSSGLYGYTAVEFGKKCTGADPCTACTKCTSCKHCAKEGGTCGVCKKNK